jgi:hypothetical protein
MPRPEYRTCERCSAQYEPTWSKQRWCSKSCAVKSHERKSRLKLNATHWIGRSCRVCGTSMLQRAERKTPTAFCSDKCMLMWGDFGSAVHAVLTCACCGTRWIRWTKPGRRRYCSDQCSQRHNGRIGKRKRRSHDQDSNKRANRHREGCRARWVAMPYLHVQGESQDVEHRSSCASVAWRRPYLRQCCSSASSLQYVAGQQGRSTAAARGLSGSLSRRASDTPPLGARENPAIRSGLS